MESFFGSLKTELVHRASFPTREAARRAVFEYIEAFYNRRRRHSALGFSTPARAYAQMARAARPTLRPRPRQRGRLTSSFRPDRWCMIPPSEQARIMAGTPGSGMTRARPDRSGLPPLSSAPAGLQGAA